MRKIFRMKYEPCNGRCYSSKEVVDLSFLEGDLAALRNITCKLVKAHDPLCGNENLAYGIDYDEENKLFIAFFLHYTKVELFSDTAVLPLLHKLCDAAIAHFDSPEGKSERSSESALGHDVCEHGKDEDLLKFMIEHSGIPTPNGVAAFIEAMKCA